MLLSGNGPTEHRLILESFSQTAVLCSPRTHAVLTSLKTHFLAWSLLTQGKHTGFFLCHGRKIASSPSLSLAMWPRGNDFPFLGPVSLSEKIKILCWIVSQVPLNSESVSLGIFKKKKKNLNKKLTTPLQDENHQDYLYQLEVRHCFIAHFILTSILKCLCCSNSQAQRGWISCLRLHSMHVVGLSLSSATVHHRPH